MSEFAAALAKFNVTAEQRVKDAFVNVTNEVKRSVVEGSELTGAPGQPVRDNELKPSWIGEFVSPSVYELTTNTAHAQPIEDGGNSFGPFTLRSKVGGFHSVALTVASYADRIVPFAVLRAKGESGDAVFGNA